MAAGKQDIFLNGTLIGDDLSEAQLASGSSIDSLMFYGQSSTGNVGSLSLDDISYGDITAVPEPATLLGGFLMISVLGWNQRRRLGGLGGLLQTARTA